MSRRSQLAGTAAIALVLCLAVSACAGGGGNAGATGAASPSATTPSGTVLPMPDLTGQTVTVYTYGGSFAESFDKAVVKPFEKATGATVELVTTCCAGFENSMMSDQFVGDIIMGNDYGPMLRYSETGLLRDEPRLAQIARARGVDPAYYQSDLLAVDFYGYVLAWNTKTAGQSHPTTWAEFMDTQRFTGSRGLFNLPNSMLEAAELGTGTSPSSLYTSMTVDSAMGKLATLRRNSTVEFWKDGADLQNGLGTGKFDYAVAFSNRIIQGREAGLPIDASFDQALLAASGAAIPKNATNVDGAVALLDFYLQPEIQATFAEESALAPAYPSANALISERVRPLMITAPENIDKAVRVDDAWWARHRKEAVEKYTAWVGT